MKIHIGMRKIKSILAVFFSFLIWQLIRQIVPELETHPIFAYIYAVIEMRETPEKTQEFAKLRMKATIIGLLIGLLFIAITTLITNGVFSENIRLIIEIALVMLAVLCSLCISELFKCKNFCGIAAIITVICMVSLGNENAYFYAIMRSAQTLVGVFSAVIVNTFLVRKNKR